MSADWHAPDAEAKSADTEVAQPTEVGSEEIINAFKAAYQRAGRPRIAIFWNRRFDDQLSQWTALRRQTQTIESSSVREDKFTPNGERLFVGPYERSLRGGDLRVAAKYTEVPTIRRKRKGLSGVSGFTFSASYLKPFLAHSVKIIDRDAIMRLVQRDNVRDAGLELVSDSQKVETDALVGYADYLAEILPSRGGAHSPATFMVSVKEVKTGQVIAMFNSTAIPPHRSAPAERYVPTEYGYTLIANESPSVNPAEAGEQLALETMQAISQAW